jgi:hypothetical protein
VILVYNLWFFFLYFLLLLVSNKISLFCPLSWVEVPITYLIITHNSILIQIFIKFTNLIKTKEYFNFYFSFIYEIFSLKATFINRIELFLMLIINSSDLETYMVYKDNDKDHNFYKRVFD